MPIISSDPRIQEEYRLLRLQGTSHNLAAMFALQAPPQSKSDREFLMAHSNQFADQPRIGDMYAKKSAECGFTDVKGKVYLRSLAEFPGDPRAWVSGRGDVKKVCEERGWSCEGDVQVKGSEIKGEHKRIKLGEDIIERNMKRMIRDDPALALSDQVELREAVIEKHGGPQ